MGTTRSVFVFTLRSPTYVPFATQLNTCSPTLDFFTYIHTYFLFCFAFVFFFDFLKLGKFLFFLLISCFVFCLSAHLDKLASVCDKVVDCCYCYCCCYCSLSNSERTSRRPNYWIIGAHRFSPSDSATSSHLLLTYFLNCCCKLLFLPHHLLFSACACQFYAFV